MRPVGRPQRLSDSGHAGPQRDRGGNGVTQRRIRDDRLFGALCHAGVYLGLWGIVTTAVIWANRKDRSRVLRLQGAQAIVYQFLVQTILLAGAIFCALWIEHGPAGSGGRAATEAVGLWASSGFLSGLIAGMESTPIIGLAILQAFLGFIALLLMILCLVGLEPSYPLVGFITRKILGLRSERRPPEKEKAPTPQEQKTGSTVTEKA